jgi:hypothetical protein
MRPDGGVPGPISEGRGGSIAALAGPVAVCAFARLEPRPTLSIERTGAEAAEGPAGPEGPEIAGGLENRTISIGSDSTAGVSLADRSPFARCGREIRDSPANIATCATAEIAMTVGARIADATLQQPLQLLATSAILTAMRFLVRIACILAVLMALPVLGASLLGRAGAIAGVALSLLSLLYLWLWLPRLAHAAFEAGRFPAAARRYLWLQRLAHSAPRERVAVLSRVGCAVSTGDLERAEQLSSAIDSGQLAAAERAVWLNNRACAQLAANQDPAAALALADEAGALRPDVPALQHTRAVALIAVGRIDDAIGVLDGMRAGGELPPRLEAERCRDLSRAWSQKGETAYADDYRLRAEAFSR